jgi:hypothetical protein
MVVARSVVAPYLVLEGHDHVLFVGDGEAFIKRSITPLNNIGNYL